MPRFRRVTPSGRIRATFATCTSPKDYTGLAAGTTHYYRVQSVGRKGIVSPFSNA